MLVAQNLCNIYGMRTCVCFVVQLMYFAVVVNACKTCNRFRKKKGSKHLWTYNFFLSFLHVYA